MNTLTRILRLLPRAALLVALVAAPALMVPKVNAGDRVIFSSWAIPGNEREVIDIQNLLIDRGIEVITQNDGLVHTTGHPRREELKRLYDLVKPAVLDRIVAVLARGPHRRSRRPCRAGGGRHAVRTRRIVFGRLRFTRMLARLGRFDRPHLRWLGRALGR